MYNLRGTSYWPAPPPPPNIPITIFGSASDTALQEFALSIQYATSIYLGAPDYVENFISLAYNLSASAPLNFEPSIHTQAQSTANLCMPDIQTYYRTQYDGSLLVATSVLYNNMIWNGRNGLSQPQSIIPSSWYNPANTLYNPGIAVNACSTLLTPSILQLIPYASRNFITQWIYERSVRYKTFYKSQPPSSPAPPWAASGAASISPTTKISIPITINVTSTTLLNSIAQQFYEMVGGLFEMSFIYDALSLGTSMIDLRIDLKPISSLSDAGSTTNSAINALKIQYNTLLQGGHNTMPQDIVSNARLGYQAKMSSLVANQISTSPTPVQGAIIRAFCTGSGTNINITGFIFDPRGVTSFIPELNGGITVPIGSVPGNVNYSPKIVYDKNRIERLNCNEEEELGILVSFSRILLFSQFDSEKKYDRHSS